MSQSSSTLYGLEPAASLHPVLWMYTTSLPQTTIILFSGFLHQHQTTLRDDKGKSVQTT